MTKSYAYVMFNVMKRFVMNLFKGESKPFFLIAFITSKCSMNGECKSCFRPASTQASSDMTMNTIESIIQDQIPIVLLSGGEPTEHPSFLQISNALNNSKSKIYILTNGYHVDKILNIENRNKLRVILSLNQYCDISSIQIKSNALRELKAAGIRTYVNLSCDCSNINLDSLFSSHYIIENADRIYLSKYVFDSCEYSKSDYIQLRLIWKFILGNFKHSIVTYPATFPRLFLPLMKVISATMKANFNLCSGYPIRATMVEDGTIKSCIRSDMGA